MTATGYRQTGYPASPLSPRRLVSNASEAEFYAATRPSSLLRGTNYPVLQRPTLELKHRVTFNQGTTTRRFRPQVLTTDHCGLIESRLHGRYARPGQCAHDSGATRHINVKQRVPHHACSSNLHNNREVILYQIILEHHTGLYHRSEIPLSK